MSWKRTLIASALMIGTAVFVNFLSNSGKDVYALKPLSTFPKQFGDWRGVEQRFDDEIYTVLGVDDSFLATYVNPQGRQVQLYIGFYKSQREGDIIHSPKNCMPGSGWNIVKTSFEELDINQAPFKKVKVIEFKLKNGLDEQMVLYWYQSRGRVISSEYLQKIYLVYDSITRNRTDGSFIRLIAPVHKDNEDLTNRFLKDFAQMIFPTLTEYLPS